MNKVSYTIITCGTSGHVNPALTVLEAGLKEGYYMGLIIDKKTVKKYENILSEYKKQYGDFLKIVYTDPFFINFNFLKPSPFHFFKKFLSFCKFIFSLFYNFFIFFKNIWIIRPLVKSTKMHICFVSGLQIPTLFGIFLFRKKYILHEQDSILNKTNKIFKVFAYKVNSSFKKVEGIKKNIFTGCPLNFTLNSNLKTKKIITILAGTNGSEVFDENIPKILENLIKKQESLKEYTIYHNCRKENETKVKEIYERGGICATVSSYFYNYEDLIQWSEFLITRAGASTISYLGFYRKNAIIIPWKDSSQNHQEKNGNIISNGKGAIVLLEKFIERDLEKHILYFLNLGGKESFGKNISGFFRTISGEDYIKLCEK